MNTDELRNVTTLPGLVLDTSESELRLRCSLASERRPLDLETLRGIMRDAGFGAWAVQPPVLAAAISKWNGADGEFELVIAQREDSSVSVELSPDGSAAWFSIKPARGGAALTADGLVQALQAAGVVHGIDEGAIQRALRATVPGRLVAASAVPAQPGKDAWFELLVADTRDRTPQVDAQGLIDFHELGDIPIVHAGQALMRRHPPTAGVDGTDVRGQPIAAVAGLDSGFDTTLTGAAPDPQNPDLLLATCSGQPVHNATSVLVEQVLRLQGVNLATGNVSFDGTIEITGDIEPGMKVHASGDIVVKGTVEGAHVDCGGSLQVSGGIIARAVVEAGNAVSARFVENVEVRAKTTIAVFDTAAHSQLQALNEVLVGTKAGHRGRLVGGLTRAMMRVQVPLLGSPAGGVTKVQVGLNPEIEAKLLELDRRIDVEKSDEDKLEKVVRHLTRQGDPRGMLPKVKAARQQALAVWGQSLTEKAAVKKELALAVGARIEVLDAVEGDVDLQFGHGLRRLRRSAGAGVFSVDTDGEVVFTDGSGAVRKLG